MGTSAAGRVAASRRRPVRAPVRAAAHTPTHPSTHASPRRAGRPREAQRGEGGSQRQALLGAVYELISREGMEQVSMRQIAAEAGVSTGTLNYHFGNKQNLLVAALEAAYRLPKDWEAYQGSPAAQLERLAMSYVMRSAHDRWWLFWINYLALGSRNAVMQAEQRRRFERQRRFWVRLIGDAVQAGEFRAGIDAQAAALQLLVEAHGVVTLQLMSPGAPVRRLARQRMQAALAALRAR